MNGRTLPVRRLGQPRAPISDLYHNILLMRWRSLFLLLLILFLSINLFFAGLYSLSSGCVRGEEPLSFSDLFFFSVQSFSTIGYGVMSPQTTYAHILVTCEAFLGLVTTGLIAGVIFSKFAVPTTRVLFADKALLTRRDGFNCLLFRLANGRGNAIVSVRVQATLIITDTTIEGEFTRRLNELKLTTCGTPILTLSFTGVHRIVEDSPLCNLTEQELEERDAIVAVTLTGIDETLGQTVHAQYFYRAGDLLSGHRFVDVLKLQGDGESFFYQMDYRKFNDVEPFESKIETPL